MHHPHAAMQVAERLFKQQIPRSTPSGGPEDLTAKFQREAAAGGTHPSGDLRCLIIDFRDIGTCPLYTMAIAETLQL
jgi:hypothetical protein